jgi:acylphosphatase
VTTRRFLVTGRVQGVGYRAFVRREALRLGLAGSARNLADGTVEVVAAGNSEKLVELERALRRGPRLSQVVAVESVAILVEFDAGKSFDIR